MSNIPETLNLVKARQISLEEAARRIRSAQALARISSSTRFLFDVENVDEAPSSSASFGPDCACLTIGSGAEHALPKTSHDGRSWPAFARSVPALESDVETIRAAWPELAEHREVLVVITDPGDYSIERDGERSAPRSRAIYRLLLSLAQAIVRGGRTERLTVVAASFGKSTAPELSAIEALFRVLGREIERVEFRFWRSCIDDGDATARVAELIRASLGSAERFGIVVGGRVVRTQLREEAVRLPAEDVLQRLEGQTAVISGGTGKIGLALAEALRRRGVRVALLGRREAALGDQLLSEHGLASDVVYEQVAVSSLEAVTQACERVRTRLGPIAAVFQCAGVTDDGLALRKPEDAAEAVLSPKVDLTWALHRATAGDPIRYFVAFSSASGVFGTEGQADYAYANACLDGLIAARAVSDAPGLSLSVCWPLWASGGMAPAASVVAAWRERFGLEPLPNVEAFDMLFALMAEGAGGRQLVLHGDASVFRSRARDALATPNRAAPVEVSDAIDVSSEAEFVALLSSLVARQTKLPIASVRVDQLFGDFGLDSVMILQMTARLEELLGPLPKTLFYEFGTIQSLAKHLVEKYGARRRTEKSPSSAQALEQASRLPLLRSRLSGGEATQAQSTREVAIVGLAGRYPKARDLQEFWQRLENGEDCITEIPESRFDWKELYSESGQGGGQIYSKWGGFLDDVEAFEPRLFNIMPNDAELMDPQQRLFLEIVHELLEDAGYTRENVCGPARKVGVYVGVMWAEYSLVGLDASRRGGFRTTRSQYWEIPNRASYFFDFRGPSLALDSACSSSLTALHYAAQAVATGACEVAVAGGVNLSLHPSKYQGLCDGRFASSHGRCKSFGDGGDGYVPGEGVGAVLLKPLQRAILDGDNIYGVIRGTSVNHGGRQNGFSVPSPVAQAELISEALAQSKLPASAIGYIEAHGTGTHLGDPIEVRGLVEAFQRAGGRGEPCPIGSVKSNIGHLEAASGIAGLTKVLLQMRHQTLVPSLHADTENPKAALGATQFYLNKRAVPWSPAPGRAVRAACISSFGAGGSNAHAVIEECALPSRERETLAAPRSPQLILLSARTVESLVGVARKLLAFIERPARPPLEDVAYTLAVGREQYAQRWCCLASSFEELAQQLESLVADERSQEWLAGAMKDWCSREQRARDGVPALEIARRWIEGEAVDFRQELYRGEVRRRVSLPTYHFQRKAYWVG
jgi:3-oxoacyl-(acyl-carrier-protein) synthase/NAD(P)-dependent dehydrogenase (short-subunit alcohol dehydrogenase family)